MRSAIVSCAWISSFVPVLMAAGIGLGSKQQNFQRPQLQPQSIVVDGYVDDDELLTCLDNLIFADSDFNFELERDEFADFLALESNGRINTAFEFLELEFVAIFYSEACTTCFEETNFDSCCVEDTAHINLEGEEPDSLFSTIVYVCGSVNEQLVNLYPDIFAPTASPTSLTPSPTSSPTIVFTEPPTRSPSVSPSATPTPAPSNSPTKIPTNSPTIPPTDSPTSSTSSPTLSGSAFPTTAMPTTTPTVSPSVVPTSSPSSTPTTLPSASPTVFPSSLPTSVPTTAAPSSSPTANPTRSPTITESPTSSTDVPTSEPTNQPSLSPTSTPTTIPVATPTTVPTSSPTLAPSATPTSRPTSSPTSPPSSSPTLTPTSRPSSSPTSPPSSSPTVAPSATPTTASPTTEIPPTANPTITFHPTGSPTNAPTATPSAIPTTVPTSSPTSAPSATPTSPPTSSPTSAPSAAPTTASPLSSPTAAPSSLPTPTPSISPTAVPTSTPTIVPTADPDLLCVRFSYQLNNLEGLTPEDILNQNGNLLRSGLEAAGRNITIEVLNATFPRDTLQQESELGGDPQFSQQNVGFNPNMLNHKRKRRYSHAGEHHNTRNLGGYERAIEQGVSSTFGHEKAQAILDSSVDIWSSRISSLDKSKRSLVRRNGSRRLVFYTDDRPNEVLNVIENFLSCPASPEAICVIVLQRACVILEEGDDPNVVSFSLRTGLRDAINNGDFAAAIPAESLP